MPCDSFAPGRLKPKNGPLGDVLVELRAVRERAGADAVEDLDRHAAGVAAVFSISGGTAEISATLATRAVPCRPM